MTGLMTQIKKLKRSVRKRMTIILKAFKCLRRKGRNQLLFGNMPTECREEDQNVNFAKRFKNVPLVTSNIFKHMRRVGAIREQSQVYAVE